MSFMIWLEVLYNCGKHKFVSQWHRIADSDLHTCQMDTWNAFLTWLIANIVLHAYGYYVLRDTKLPELFIMFCY